MHKYIVFTLGGKAFRFLIDDKLDGKLKKALKDDYKLDQNNYLVLEKETISETYRLKQKVLKELLSCINDYDLPENFQKDVDLLKEYTDSKLSVYYSDLVKLEELIGKAADIYGTARNSLQTKQVAKEQKDELAKSVEQLNEEVKESNPEDDRLNSFVGITDNKIADFKEILAEISQDENLSENINVDDINDAIDRVVICSSMEEYLDKVGHNPENQDLAEQIKNKGEKIILPPNTKLEDVVTNIIYHSCKDKETFDKVVTYMERKNDYQNKVSESFEKLRSDLKVYGLSARNFNYFGDQFIEEFERICKETGISFETMFADYFNGYSENRKYNSALNTFITRFIKFHGGDENTRAMLEALIVKKAISRHLISAKYNRYLNEEYRNLEVSGNGYVKFQDRSFEMFSRAANDGDSIAGETAEATGASTSSLNEQTSIGINQNKTASLVENTEISDVGDSYVTAQGGGVAERRIPYDKKAPKSLHQASKETGIGELTDKSKIDSSLDKSATTGDGEGLLVRNTMASYQRKKLIGGVAAQTSARLGIGGTSESDALPKVHMNHGNLNPNFDDIIDEDDVDFPDSDMDYEGGEEDSALNGNADDEKEESPTDGESAGGESGENSEEHQKKKKPFGKILLEFIKKNPWVLIIVGIIFIIILVLFSAGQEFQTESGYFDTACNYNDTNITLVDCDTENTSMGFMTLQDYVIKMTYAYTKNTELSDEALKALMIVLKTNGLSYGNYSSGNKNLEVNVCDVFIDYNNKPDGANNDWMFEGVDGKKEKLSSIYNSISDYLFVSSSYKSSISSLGSQNIIPMTSSTLSEFESLAQEGKDYGSILKDVFGTNESTNENTTQTNSETIFIGDSRTQGMLINSIIDEAHTVYGTGYGYNWFIGNGSFESNKTNATSGAISEANNKMTTGSSYNIVLWLGINDLGSGPDRYFEKYVELATGDWSSHHLYVVSIGPVDDSKASVTNESINNFNNQMSNLIASSGLGNLTFINLNYTQESITNYDGAGLHYGSSDYQKIYSIITNNLGGITLSKTLELYRLSDYCTYYNVTDNVAYWWPIGSAEPTNGNIYGGEPTAKTITSHFGRRNLTGEGETHHAIDIAGGNGHDVIIASRSGTVTETNDGCGKGSLSNRCGGGYGNFVLIDHGDGITTRYSHMLSGSIVVKEGDTVVQGQKLGIMGESGRVTGVHLDFKVMVNGTIVDPEDYVSAENPRPVNVSIQNGAVIAGTSSGDASETKQLVCKSLLASGFSENAVVAAMVNIQHEGSFKLTNMENCYETGACCKTKSGKRYGYCTSPQIGAFGSDDKYTAGVDSGSYSRENFINDHAGYGLIQWTSSGRKARLYDYSKQIKKSIGSFDTQFGYLYTELQEYTNTWTYLTGNYSAYDMSVMFCKDFERPSGSTTVFKTRDSCYARADQELAVVQTYVKNGCSN